MVAGLPTNFMPRWCCGWYLNTHTHTHKHTQTHTTTHKKKTHTQTNTQTNAHTDTHTHAHTHTHTPNTHTIHHLTLARPSAPHSSRLFASMSVLCAYVAWAVAMGLSHGGIGVFMAAAPLLVSAHDPRAAVDPLYVPGYCASRSARAPHAHVCMWLCDGDGVVWWWCVCVMVCDGVCVCDGV